jgi:RNA polymerase sigma-70 factor, ECF subfamily
MSKPAQTDEQRFRDLYQGTRRDLLAYLVRRAGSAEDAAEALSETYLIAWQKLDTIPPGDQARLWLFGVARNLLMKGATRRRTHDALVERLANELRAAQPALAGDDEARRTLKRALATLQERDREILTLTAWDGLTPREIAAVMNTSANVIRIRLHRSRAHLRKQLSQMRGDIPQPTHTTIEREG